MMKEKNLKNGGINNKVVNNEEELIKKMTIDMECTKYDMPCLDVPYEVLTYVGGFGFSNYKCDLNCKNCSEMEETI